MKKDFNKLITTMKSSIATYGYFVDFPKVFKNIEDIAYNLNVLNHLIGQPDFDTEFIKTLERNPDVIRVLPILLAIRENKVEILEDISVIYDFRINQENHYYLDFIKRTGLIQLFYDHRVKNLVDYAIGVEVGLDSNARKNRSGVLMSKLVLSHLNKIKDIKVMSEVTLQTIEKFFEITVDETLKIHLSNKRFDFAVKDKNRVYLIETNYYGGGGSKLNETARSYMKLASDIAPIRNVSFIWTTDGLGWLTTKNNLKEAYDSIEYLFNIHCLEEGCLLDIFNA